MSKSRWLGRMATRIKAVSGNAVLMVSPFFVMDMRGFYHEMEFFIATEVKQPQAPAA
jgi:hypothetical protein